MITAQTTVALAAQGSTCYGNRITDQLYGPHAANARQAIMSGIAGKFVPKSKCSASAVRAALANVFGIDLQADCIAVVDDKIDAAIRAAAQGE